MLVAQESSRYSIISVQLFAGRSGKSDSAEASPAVQSTPPARLDWDCLGSLVTAELQHRRSGRQVVLTPDSSIEFAVMSALAAYQGASLLTFVAQALKVAPPPAPAQSLLNRLVRLRYASSSLCLSRHNSSRLLLCMPFCRHVYRP